MFTTGILKDWSTDPVADREMFFQAELKMVGEMKKAGVPILAGTDTAAGVRVYPGVTTLTRMPRGLSSAAMALAIVRTAALLPA